MTVHPSVDETFTCWPCTQGHHGECMLTVARVQYRTNYFRCSCDAHGHPRRVRVTT